MKKIILLINILVIICLTSVVYANNQQVEVVADKNSLQNEDEIEVSIKLLNTENELYTYSGEIQYDNLTILLYSTLAAVAKRVILCHEIAHGILYESSCKQHNDETLIAPLGYFLYMLLRDNDFEFMRG